MVSGQMYKQSPYIKEGRAPIYVWAHLISLYSYTTPLMICHCRCYRSKREFTQTAFCGKKLRFLLRWVRIIRPAPRRMLILAPFGAKISILRGSGTPVILRRYLIKNRKNVKSQNASSVNSTLLTQFWYCCNPHVP